MAIPTGWRVHRRASDGERVGYLASADDVDDLVTPLSLVGTPLGPPQPEADAADLLNRTGLAALGQRWWCRLPTPVPARGADPAAAETGWDWRPVAIVEIQPHRCTIRPEFPAPSEQTRLVVLPIPVGDRLRPTPEPEPGR